MTFLFDFDGTLVDSMPRWERKMLNILESYGVAYPDDIIRTLTPLGDNGCAELFIKMGVPLSKEEIFRLMDAYAIPAYRDSIPAKPTVEETLRYLHSKGHTLAVLTASPHTLLDPCLKRLGLWDVFDRVWSCDDFHTGKTDIAIYGKCAEALGVGVGECVFLDDNYNALETARASGMRTVGVFDESSRIYTEQIRALCDGYVEVLHELIALFSL